VEEKTAINRFIIIESGIPVNPFYLSVPRIYVKKAYNKVIAKDLIVIGFFRLFFQVPLN